MSSEDLSRILQGLPTGSQDPRILVGFESADDAGVYRLDADRALVMTVDVITPLVDDPFDYGRIAATNAISDVYAMGGRPLAALNIAGFHPKLPAELYQEVLRGAAEVALVAGCPIVGGHTIKDNEIKFGLAVVGEVHPDHILSNRGAQPGDALILTKPLGTAAIATAFKAGAVDEQGEAYVAMVASMTTLNGAAAELAIAAGAHALTDITGFGLSGHGLEVATASDVDLEIDVSELPELPRAVELLEAGFTCGGGTTNAHRAAPEMAIDGDLSVGRLELLHDPQTSGGLLIALPKPQAQDLVGRLREAGYPQASLIGSAKSAVGPRFRVLT